MWPLRLRHSQYRNRKIGNKGAVTMVQDRLILPQPPGPGVLLSRLTRRDAFAPYASDFGDDIMRNTLPLPMALALNLKDF